MKTLCVEGWRGINHSIAMVNQHQLLALMDAPDIQLYHRDCPYFMKHWSRQTMSAGFTAEAQARIDALAEPPAGTREDVRMRLTSPFSSRIEPGVRTLTFMVTEVGLVPECFDAPPQDVAAYTRDGNRVFTPSTWSRDRLVDYGIDPAGIAIVPHGMKAEALVEPSAIERELLRRAMGIAADEIVFLNVGVATWNKGLDLLVRAWARLRQRQPRVRLLLKDHKSLYKVGVEHVLAQVSRAHPGLLGDGALAGVSVISDSLDQAQMRALYALCDAYVSPYRAEGFNLPVLEAMACGAPVIVTEGGATEDFCPVTLAQRVASRPGRPEDAPQVDGCWREPDEEALLEAMAAVADGRVRRDDPARDAARARLRADHAWPAVVRRALLPLI
ncbi:MAG: hypothetical protein RIQ53_3426 [Pseudomonadota bacterium]|jgi:glycosyltransferase involved in cell wall biosynthesis